MAGCNYCQLYINEAMRRLLIVLLFVVGCVEVMAQDGGRRGHVDVLMGAEFNYRHLGWRRLYEVLVNLTPAVKWQFGDHWQIAGQMLVPVFNDYGDYYKRIRPNMIVLSKEDCIGGSMYFKLSAGLFSRERYGLDLKWMLPVNQWLAFDAQLGYTGLYTRASGDRVWSAMDRLSGWAGARFYLERWNTEFRLRGGRFIYEDYGGYGEVYRHFRHCSIGLYAQWNDKEHANGGFKVIMMLPPYSRKNRTLTVRPASNFRLTNNINADPYSVKMYETDPEENEREGFFDRQSLRWGANKMEPDFNVHD